MVVKTAQCQSEPHALTASDRRMAKWTPSRSGKAVTVAGTAYTFLELRLSGKQRISIRHEFLARVDLI